MTMTIGLGKAGQIEVDVEALRKMAHVEEYIFQYGLKQMLNDVHAGEKDADKKLALSQKKLDSLLRGEVAQARAFQSADPVMREMRRMAEEALLAQVKKIGKKRKDYENAKWAELVGQQVERRETAYRAAAERIVAERVESIDDDVIDL
jgi:hypothetical protein